jgi:hypothetical protein
MRPNFVLPLPRLVLHPVTAATIAAIHVYLSLGHLSQMMAGQVKWVHIWKGFGALFGAYVFAALAMRGMLVRRQQAARVARDFRNELKKEGVQITLSSGS